jgi:hypothetical protein
MTSINTFSFHNNIYSVDMMFSFIHDFLPKKKIFPVTEFQDELFEYVWDDNNNNPIRPVDVMKNPQQYPEHVARIKKASLNYPVIIGLDEEERYIIIDGFHRLVKSFLLKKETIETYFFPTKLLNKFIIFGQDDEKEIADFQVKADLCHIQQLYRERFKKPR